MDPVISWIALGISLVTAAVSIPLAIRADRRAAAESARERVKWVLELDGKYREWIRLRNVGRVDAREVAVVPSSLRSVAVRGIPDDEFVQAGSSTVIFMAEEAELSKLPDSIDVTWRVWSRFGARRGQQYRAVVPTSDLRRAIVDRG